MANGKKIKADVHVNDPGYDGTGLLLDLSAAQAVEVLNSVISGDTLYINLITSTDVEREIYDNPKAYAS